MCSSDIFLGFLAILFPPIAVWIKAGICSADSLINILLCMLGWLPGMLHAWYIISLYPEPSDDEAGGYVTIDSENPPPAHAGHRVTYYYVNRSAADGEGLNAGGRPVMYGTIAGIPAQQPKPVGGMGRGGAQAQQAPPPQQQQQPQPQPQPEGQGGQQGVGEGSGGGEQVPPSYDQAVAGDNKVQR